MNRVHSLPALTVQKFVWHVLWALDDHDPYDEPVGGRTLSGGPARTAQKMLTEQQAPY
jgi:hypothetical protein